MRIFDSRAYVLASQPAICSGDQSSCSFAAINFLRAGIVASLDFFGRLALAQARSSARLARYLVRPPLREISRLTVDAARSSRAAIARTLRPFTRQREISSRSRS